MARERGEKIPEREGGQGKGRELRFLCNFWWDSGDNKWKMPRILQASECFTYGGCAVVDRLHWRPWCLQVGKWQLLRLSAR